MSAETRDPAPPGAESALRGRMLFLVGARRSGTNWLERMLTAHPEIVAMPSETHLFSHGVAPLTDLVQHSSPGSRTPAQTFADRARFLAASRALLDEIFLENLERLRPDARFLLERTPWHSRHLPLIEAVYPDARILHIVRDGRAVARSLLSMHWGPETMEEAAAEWRDCALGGREGAALFGERYLELRYEDLAGNPLEEVDAVFGWLGLEVDGTLRAEVAVEANARFNVDPASPSLRPDKWRESLTHTELADFMRAAGGALDELGYEGDTARRGWPARGTALHSRVRQRSRLARRAKSETANMKRSLQTFERFMELLRGGRRAEARALCADDAYYGYADAANNVAGRGDAPFEALSGALAAHAATERQVFFTRVHPGTGQLAGVSTYELADGSRWTATLIVDMRNETVTGAALYRFELA